MKGNGGNFALLSHPVKNRESAVYNSIAAMVL